jgi:hypothetical protein
VIPKLGEQGSVTDQSKKAAQGFAAATCFRRITHRQVRFARYRQSHYSVQSDTDFVFSDLELKAD